MTTTDRDVRDILQAQVYGVAVETPTQPMPQLSRRLGHDIRIKREDLQPIFSFKLRGAANKLSRLGPRAATHGVIAASAGNHAQGVALAAARHDVPALIVMPRTTPKIKVRAVLSHGAEVIFHGDHVREALHEARRLAKKTGRIFIHPFDDRDVIAGQGTAAVELLRQIDGPLHAVFIPVGGGGLLAGMATYLKYVRPNMQVIGVECDESACLTAALEAGRRVSLKRVGIFADGIAVSQVGREPFSRIRKLVDRVITVSPDEICGAIRDIFNDTRSIAEPAGAVAVAGLKRYAESCSQPGRVLATVESGANVDFNVLRYISERAEIGEDQEAILSLALPECPGALRKACGALGDHDVTMINYRYRGPGVAHFLLGIQLIEGDREKRSVIEKLARRAAHVEDLTADELTKTHLSHMIGGHPADISDEFVGEFHFPERPGVLREFLDVLGEEWNLTLLHYRKQGGENARVLAGIDTSRGRSALMRRLRELDFPYTDVSASPTYRRFLGVGPAEA